MATTPKLTVYKMVVDLDPVRYVTDDSTGTHLQCQIDKLSNCEHIGRVLNDNLDTYIFDLEGFEVPLSLKHSVWVPIHVSGETVAAGTAKKYGVHGSAAFFTGQGRPKSDAPDRALGLLSRGEGRKVVRNTLASWLHGWTAAVNPACRSRTHGPKQEDMMKAADPQEKLVNEWWLLTTGTCWYCGSYSSQDMDDLIPKNPNTSSRGAWGGKSKASFATAR